MVKTAPPERDVVAVNAVSALTATGAIRPMQQELPANTEKKLHCVLTQINSNLFLYLTNRFGVLVVTSLENILYVRIHPGIIPSYYFD